PRFADTVAYGCYRRNVFDRIGLYNESLNRSSDMDLNVRLRRAGGTILLVPDLVIRYVPHPGYWTFLARTFKLGFWVTPAGKFGGRPMRLRHAAPIAMLLTVVTGLATMSIFPLSGALLAGAIILYVLVIAVVSVKLAILDQNSVVGLCLPLIFATRH